LFAKGSPKGWEAVFSGLMKDELVFAVSFSNSV
jgi:hypothetical protein